jgi:signal transduction histidine kinase
MELPRKDIRQVDVATATPPEKRRGQGLYGMIERIELRGCSLRFDFHPDEGTTIHLEVPSESEEGIR